MPKLTTLISANAFSPPRKSRYHRHHAPIIQQLAPSLISRKTPSTTTQAQRRSQLIPAADGDTRRAVKKISILLKNGVSDVTRSPPVDFFTTAYGTIAECKETRNNTSISTTPRDRHMPFEPFALNVRRGIPPILAHRTEFEAA